MALFNFSRMNSPEDDGVRNYRIHPPKKRTRAPSTRLDTYPNQYPLTQFRVTNLKVIRKPIDGLSYLISDNLVENMKYQFRVISFNEDGMSPPSDPTAEVTIEDPTYAPGKLIVRVSDSTKSTIKLSHDRSNGWMYREQPREP